MCQPYASSVSVTLCFWYCTDWHFFYVLLNVLLCVSFLPQVDLERGTPGNHSNIHGPTPGKLSSKTTKEPEQPTQSRSGHVPHFTPLFPPHQGSLEVSLRTGMQLLTHLLHICLHIYYKLFQL